MVAGLLADSGDDGSALCGFSEDGLLSTARTGLSGVPLGALVDTPATIQRFEAATAEPLVRRVVRLPVELRTLRKSFVGADVEGLQKRLNRRMGAGLAASGTFDQATHDAVLRLQAELGLTTHGMVTREVWFGVLCENATGEPATSGRNVEVPEWSLEERFRGMLQLATANQPSWAGALLRGAAVDGFVALAGETIFGSQDVFTVAEWKLVGQPPGRRFDVAAAVDQLLEVGCRAATVHDIQAGAGLLTDLIEATGVEALLQLLERRGRAGSTEPDEAAPSEPAPAPAPAQAASHSESEEPLQEIRFRLVDREMNPLSGARYRIEMTDGNVMTGTITAADIDAEGWVDFYDLPAGDCVVSFSDLGQAKCDED